jgi:hypothetical protein
MNKNALMKATINEILKHSNSVDLSNELKVQENELSNYLDQCTINAKKEISAGIFVIPLTGSENLRSII